MASKVFRTMALALLAVKLAESAVKEPITSENKPQATEFKEVIMYLTPSQIRAYEKNQRIEESKNVEKKYRNKNYSSELQNQLLQQNHEANLWAAAFQKHNEQKVSQKQEQSVQQPTQHEINTPAAGAYQQSSLQEQHVYGQNYQQQYLKQQQNIQEPQRPYLFVDFSQEVLQRHREEHLKQQLEEKKESQQMFHPEAEYLKQIDEITQSPNQLQIPHEEILKELVYQKYQLVPYDYKPNNLQFHKNLGKQILEQINHDESQSKGSVLNQEPLSANNPSQQQQYAYDVETLLGEIRMEKLRAQANAEAIAKSPPVVVHRDISIVRRRPTHIIKTINVPVPAPFLVPVPEPYEVKVPQPYPVPVEIIRPYAVPIVKTETIEVEKPVPVEVEKRVPVPVEKKVYVPVDRPYAVERAVPVLVRREVPVYRPEKVTVLRHVWSH